MYIHGLKLKNMKYDRINKDLYIHNRKRFAEKMEGHSLAIFNSNDIYPISADSTMPFQQHRDILHLSGVDQEESVLVIFPTARNEKHREVLFLKETNEHIAIWEGEKLDKKNAFEVSGIQTVYWLDQLDVILKQMLSDADTIYINTNAHLRANTEVETREDRFTKALLQKYPAHQVRKSAPIMHSIRAIKHPLELELMQKACDITEKGFRRLLSFVKPGVWEYELEAELMHEFLRNRSKGFAYTPIIASGSNANVLHYIENNQECKSGDVILFDVAAEYANYASDMSRCIPVDGRFTERQKQVYNAVLHVKKEAEKMLVAGTLLSEYQAEVGLIMQDQLVQLGLIDQTDIKNQNPDWPAYKKYFMHGTSHFIGLDTHDVGHWDRPIEANMVFTCEPGIYIQEEGLGIRLEDNLVIQATGEPVNLMINIPIEADEIESIMNK